ncbi:MULTISPECIES: ABC transporter ATP-binding protein [unclassified Gordonia (in: high G+C Gram-positive bacteria)]|uniref:ABC transporter ATP-binding protein n=1 Tax=unclassified Gordonia (in: high G+C Gram-positive bacteria) TaxID=2657482 RepID=UPI001F10958F|nr:ABC transporter ATP-binding protein [Gordonia sp. ABSL49_1]MCH5643720.1 ABC transporter ATP-binding protein [Gordonia sp. ABSL49_1]
MLEITDVAVGYGSEMVIDGLTWTVGAQGGVLTALLGPSGCGKSTLLRAIAGLEPLARGDIRFDGDDLADVAVHRRDFGVVFQDGQLFGGRTVTSNVAYGLRMRRWPRAQIGERVAQMLELVDLPGFADRRVGELSGGQAQRVALARALAPQPRLLLLDEPLAALDRGLRDQLAVDIAEIVREAATPTIVVTHDHTEAALMADSISVMRAGAIVQTAPPGELWRRPADEWTAGFLGCRTIVDARVSGGVASCSLGSVRLNLPDGDRRIGLRADSVVAVPEVDGTASTATVLRAIDLPTGRQVRVGTDVGEIDAMASDDVMTGDRVALRLVGERVAVIGE